MTMKLFVHIIEARNLLSMDSNGFSDPYVKLFLSNQKLKTKVIKMNLNPVWDEKFTLEVGDIRVDLKIRVFDEDRIGIDDFLGKINISMQKVLEAEGFSLGTQWYKLLPKSEKAKSKDCGEICMTISISRGVDHHHHHLPRAFSEPTPIPEAPSELIKESSNVSAESDSFLTNGVSFSTRSTDSDSLSILDGNQASEPPASAPSAAVAGELAATEEEKVTDEQSNLQTGETPKNNEQTTLVGRIRNIFGGKNSETPLPETPLSVQTDEGPNPNLESPDDQFDDVASANVRLTFDELLKTYESKNQEAEIPPNLPGGVLLDQSYLISPADLNSLLFSPDSSFSQSFLEVQNSTDLQIESWRLENEGQILKRIVSYTTAPTKMVKAVRATDEQTYLKSNGKTFSILSSVSTPDVPFGSCFRTEILFCIIPGPDLQSEEQSSRLVVSWRINFQQSTMLKGAIESGARQGLKESYAKLADLLSQKVKILDLKESGSEKEQLLADLQAERESDWKLAVLYFGNFTVLSYVLVFLYVVLHILLAKPRVRQGLEFNGLDLPDSLFEMVIGGILALHGQQVLHKIVRFLQAREQKAGDHGVKPQGDGWMLTVALIEGNKLAAVDSTGYSDPYVVFSCNGKTKASSIKFQTLEPQWNEIFEFDAMTDPPSVMRIDVYDFDGPFDEITSLGYAEVNFVKSNLSELADVWVPLQGNLAKSCQSKLHLRIFLNNSMGTGVVTEYLNKMEKEVGHKITLRPPQAHSEFQKIFHLQSEEFLINDFSCYLKRKMPMQGRLFLSPRIIGFYSNIFGHKTKFYFLWEDVEDIQVVSPSTGRQSISIILHKGRGFDAKHGAKTIEDGKLKFHFQSFVSFTVAKRTIVALWQARSLSLEQKVRIAAEESGNKALESEDNGHFLGIQDAKKSDVFSSIILADINAVMEAFEGGALERRVMERVGCISYSSTEWESVRADVYQRHTHYRLAKNLSPCGGEATSTQQKSILSDNGKKGWVIDEVMELQGVLLGDYYNIHLRYEIEDLSASKKGCSVQVSLGVAWLKSTKHQKKVTNNVISNSSSRIREMFSQVEMELRQAK